MRFSSPSAARSILFAVLAVALAGWPASLVAAVAASNPPFPEDPAFDGFDTPTGTAKLPALPAIAAVRSEEDCAFVATSWRDLAQGIYLLKNDPLLTTSTPTGDMPVICLSVSAQPIQLGPADESIVIVDKSLRIHALPSTSSGPAIIAHTGAPTPFVVNTTSAFNGKYSWVAFTNIQFEGCSALACISAPSQLPLDLTGEAYPPIERPQIDSLEYSGFSGLVLQGCAFRNVDRAKSVVQFSRNVLVVDSSEFAGIKTEFSAILASLFPYSQGQRYILPAPDTNTHNRFVVIRNSVFESTWSKTTGSAITLGSLFGYLYVLKSTFSKAQSSRGGAIFLHNSPLRVAKSQFVECVARSDSAVPPFSVVPAPALTGGAISLAVLRGNSTIADSQFTRCSADASGGALHFGNQASVAYQTTVYQTVTVTNTAFDSCSAVQNGGVANMIVDPSTDFYTSSVQFLGCNFTANRAAQSAVLHAGAFYNTNIGKLGFVACIFLNNVFTGNGLITIERGHYALKIAACSFAGNTRSQVVSSSQALIAVARSYGTHGTFKVSVLSCTFTRGDGDAFVPSLVAVEPMDEPPADPLVLLYNVQSDLLPVQATIGSGYAAALVEVLSKDDLCKACIFDQEWFLCNGQCAVNVLTKSDANDAANGAVPTAAPSPTPKSNNVANASAAGSATSLAGLVAGLGAAVLVLCMSLIAARKLLRRRKMTAVQGSPSGSVKSVMLAKQSSGQKRSEKGQLQGDDADESVL